jgi:hypothetical protein
LASLTLLTFEKFGMSGTRGCFRKKHAQTIVVQEKIKKEGHLWVIMGAKKIEQNNTRIVKADVIFF